MKTLATAVAFALAASMSQAASYGLTFDNDAAFNAASGADTAISAYKAGIPGSWEFSVGFPADQPGNVNGQFNWANDPAAFSIGWDGAGTMTATLGGASVSQNIGAGALDPFNSAFLRIDARDVKGDSTSVDLAALTLDGKALGDLSVSSGLLYQQIIGFDLQDAWTLSGTVEFGELLRDSTPSFQFKVTDVQPVPLPAAAWLLLAGVGSLFGLGRLRRAA